MLEDLINQTHLCLFVCVCAVTQQVRPLWVRPQLISGRPLLVNIHNNNSNNNSAKRGSEKMKLMSPRAGWRVWRVLLLATNVAALCIWSIICINIDTTLSHTLTHTWVHTRTLALMWRTMMHLLWLLCCCAAALAVFIAIFSGFLFHSNCTRQNTK